MSKGQKSTRFVPCFSWAYQSIDLWALGVYTESMKKMLVMALLTGLVVSQLPTKSDCQMAFGGILAKSCAMSCCKAGMPMPKCPLLKASAPRDLITSSVQTLNDAIQPLHNVGYIALPVPRRIVTLVAGFVETIQLLIAGPSQSVRAPPTDVLLLAA